METRICDLVMLGIAMLMWIHDEPEITLVIDGADALRLHCYGVATELEIPGSTL